MITTVNISLPKSMYEDAKKMLARFGYASISELVRDAIRKKIYPELTELKKKITKRKKHR